MGKVPLQPLFVWVGGRLRAEIGFSLPNSQRQNRTFHIQQDVLPYALR
jgi:hypothetical protein